MVMTGIQAAVQRAGIKERVASSVAEVSNVPLFCRLVKTQMQKWMTVVKTARWVTLQCCAE